MVLSQPDIGQALAAGEPQLRPHQVDAGDFFGHGVLDLEARVGFDEGEVVLVVAVDEELEGSQAAVVGCCRHADGGGGQALAGCRADYGAGRPLDHLLVAALEAALTLAEVGDRAGPVADDLDLDMAGAGHQALDQDRAVAKGGCGFRLAALIRLGDLIGRRHDPHPATAAAGDRLDHHRAAVTEGIEEGRRSGEIDGSGAAGQDRHIVFGRQGPRLRFVTEQFQRIDGRSDEGDPFLVAAPGQLRTFGEEAVAGVQRVAARLLGRADHCFDIEVGPRSDAVQGDCLVGAPDVE